MNGPTLLILAAGMGSRFGGLKQITPVDPRGHAIIDYSLFDAYRAGFRRVVFIIKHGIEEDFKAFSRLLRRHHILKPKRYIPDDTFFKKAMESEGAELFVTKYHGWVIACAAVAYSEGDAYLWYSAFRRKTFHNLHPDTMVVWDVMKHAYDKGCQHMRFMDVGLPYGKNPYREFILRFGGKEQSTYRWFRFSIRWVNKLLAWIYRE